jgi:hypothetical protein
MDFSSISTVKLYEFPILIPYPWVAMYQNFFAFTIWCKTHRRSDSRNRPGDSGPNGLARFFSFSARPNTLLFSAAPRLFSLVDSKAGKLGVCNNRNVFLASFDRIPFGKLDNSRSFIAIPFFFLTLLASYGGS